MSAPVSARRAAILWSLAILGVLAMMALAQPVLLLTKARGMVNEMSAIAPFPHLGIGNPLPDRWVEDRFGRADRAVRGLSMLLKLRPSYEDRRWIVFILAQCGSDAEPVLASLVGDPDEWIRLTAAKGLARLGRPEGLEGLIRIIDSRAQDAIRAEALRSAASLEVPCTTELLIRFLKSGHEKRLRAIAARELRTVLAPEFLYVIGAYWDKDPATIEALHPLKYSDDRLAQRLAGNRRAASFLIHVMEDASLDVRWRRLATLCLASAPKSFVESALINALTSNAPEVQDEAAYCLAVHNSKAGVPALIRLLGSREPCVRVSAVKALGRIGGGDAYEALKALERDPHEDVRGALQEALERILTTP